MDNLYEALGFEKPNFMQNPYGIKIYIGTKGKEDWCVEVPKELVKEHYQNYIVDYNYVVYFVSEEDALHIAKEFTLTAECSTLRKTY
jgi:hypothetical protein